MYKKTISAILSIVIILSGLIIFSSAETVSTEPVTSSNAFNYENTRWASPVYSHIYADNGNITRVEIIDNSIYIETFDKSYNIKSSSTIAGVKDAINGVYIGKNYNYAVFSSTNEEENNNKEIARIIKYSKTWEELGSASVYGSNTTVFNDAGSLRFTEYGNYLYIHTCHEMYTTSDGYNHQANMTLVIQTDTMTVTCNKSDISNSSTGYVSHSFNQFIAADEDTDSIITVDHGDAHPRAIAMFRYNGQMGDKSLSSPSMVNIFNIQGTTGNNTTGVSVGDLIITDNNYIVTFNSINQGSDSTDRSPYLAIVPKNSFNDKSVKLIKLEAESSYCGYPYITDIGNGKYNVVWGSDTGVSYVTVDENGNMLTDIQSFDALLSDCEPIFTDSKVIWYTTYNSAPVFYSIDTSDNSGTTGKCFHSYSQTVVSRVSCDNDGVYINECIFCGDTYESTEPAFGHTDNNSDGICETCYNFIPTAAPTATVTWEKESYCAADGEAILHLNADKNVYIYSISVDSENAYYISWDSTSCTFNYYGQAGTYIIYLQLSDGQVIYTTLKVTDEPESSTEPTTEPSTEPTTEPSTDPSTEPATEPTTKPATDENLFKGNSEYSVSDNGLILTNIPTGTTFGKLLIDSHASHMAIISYDVELIVDPNYYPDYEQASDEEKQEIILNNFNTQITTGDTVAFYDENGKLMGEFICEIENESYVDFNNDGFVTSDDAIYLLKHTMQPFNYIVNGKMDFDSDGYVTTDDAIYLLKYTMVPDMYPVY